MRYKVCFLRKRISTLDRTRLQAVSWRAQYKNVKLFNNNNGCEK